MDSILGFFASSPEYQALGWNTETLINVAINLLTVNTMLGASKQAKQVWERRSAEGLSGASFSYYFFYCLAFFVYGIEKGALNMVFGSMVAIAYVPTILGTWQFGSTKEKWGIAVGSLLFATLPGIMMRLQSAESKEVFLGLLLAGMLGLLIVGFEKFRRAPGIGGFDSAFSWAFLVAGLFWIPYSYKLGATGLVLFNVVMVVVMTATLAIYYSRKNKLAQA